jgi:hypothetical protein
MTSAFLNEWMIEIDPDDDDDADFNVFCRGEDEEPQDEIQRGERGRP